MKEEIFSKAEEGWISKRYVPYNHPRGIFTLVATLLLSQMLAAQETNITPEQPIKNPHENETMCTACHASNLGGQDTLIFDDIPQLCQSCHDDKKATHEVHPVNIMPSTATAERIPSKFPLRDGKLTCSTCHNISWSCPQIRPITLPNEDFLREASTSQSFDFCFNCHIKENYLPFNVHDQIDAGKLKADACLWCHTCVPNVDSKMSETASYGLQGNRFGELFLRDDVRTKAQLCTNCHSMSNSHPTEPVHMNTKPSAEMMSYMSAYEIQPKMNIPIEQLIRYVQAPKRVPRLIPLDDNEGITCYSCHNPHEKDLLPNRNLRSIGAEPIQAKNHRLRSYEGDLSCRACHHK